MNFKVLRTCKINNVNRYLFQGYGFVYTLHSNGKYYNGFMYIGTKANNKMHIAIKNKDKFYRI